MAEYTSNLCDGGTATSDGAAAGYPASNAFDGNESNNFRSADATPPYWIQYQFTKSYAFTKLRMLSLVNRTPDAFKVQGSNNGSDYTDLLSTNFDNNSSWQEFTWSNTVKYSYIRIYITSDISPVEIYINEIELMAFKTAVNGFSGFSPWIF